MKVRIHQDLCKACGTCSQVCPHHIPVTSTDENKKITTISPERIGLCMQCGHCVAVCPHLAIQIESMDERDFTTVKTLDITDYQLLTLLNQRRSIRRYQEKPVPRKIIEKVIQAAHASPTGTGRMTTNVIVIDKTETLARLSALTYGAYEKLGKALKNPIARFIMKQKKGKQTLWMLQNFVMPGMQWYIRWYKEGKNNEILRNCPALLLFHSPAFEPMGSENCLIAAYHAIMMAQALKIGACLNSLIPPMCNRVPEMRQLLALPDDHEVYASITMGYPAYRFKRVIPRKLAEIRYLD